MIPPDRQWECTGELELTVLNERRVFVPTGAYRAGPVSKALEVGIMLTAALWMLASHAGVARREMEVVTP